MKFDNGKIAKLYRDVPVEEIERLYQFRATYPYKHTTLNGLDWQYIDAGRGEAVILMLPGALGTAESSWQTIGHLAGTYRVIAPSYPPVATMAELVDGIAMIMENEGIGHTHVLGGSYGGFVAQVFVRRHPAKVRKLVISHSGNPSVERGKKIAGVLRWLPLLPMGILRVIFEKRLASLLPQGHTEVALVRAYFKEVVGHHLTKEGLINGYRRLVDFDTHHVFTSHDLADWPGAVLLIMADDDPATPEPVRAAMQALYPQADVHMFSGTGHAASLLKRDEYLTAIEQFFG